MALPSETKRVSPADWITEHYSRIRRRCTGYFAFHADADTREDLACEAIAYLWRRLLQEEERGADWTRYGWRLVLLSCSSVRAGCRVKPKQPADHSRSCWTTHGSIEAHAEAAPRFVLGELPDSRQVNPARLAALRMDWTAFLAQQGPRCAAYLSAWGEGWRTVELSVHFNVTSGCLSSLRTKKARQWINFTR